MSKGKKAREILIGVLCFLAGFVVSIGSMSVASDALKLEEARPFKIDMGVGACKFKERESVFWQSYHAHSLKLNSLCGEVGVWAPLNEKLGWFVRYVPFGRQSFTSEAQSLPGDSEELADHSPATLHRAACQGAPNPDNCQYYWSGGGNMNGIALGMSVNAHKAGDFRVDPEFGLLFYRLKWNTAVHPYGCWDTCTWRMEINQRGREIETTPMVGVTARWGNGYVGWRLYLHSSDHTTVAAPHSGPVHQFVIGASF